MIKWISKKHLNPITPWLAKKENKRTLSIALLWETLPKDKHELTILLWVRLAWNNFYEALYIGTSKSIKLILFRKGIVYLLDITELL